ncbi:Aste57867_19275 [Aphanomyces stellatus]|uniref:Aste57867_19275 protein n=1 Tax=Aphanomyces stellatus TaxID=120398 RepID=A0A485LCC7_9STRA|nr:hypothetical protein As57867_019211 [Aphanomyces stellatus]VFT95995.1 Aste57867_19275 [Aphanomyces stellatus]
MEATRMLLLRDGTAIGGFQRPRDASSDSNTIPPTSCLVLEPSGNCFSFLSSQTLATPHMVQLFSCASCPSVHVPILRQLLDFRNKHAIRRSLYLHQHHLPSSCLEWQSCPPPSSLRWRCGTFQVASLACADGLRIKSLDGMAQVTYSTTSHCFRVSFVVPVAFHPTTLMTTSPAATGSRTLVTRLDQLFFPDDLPSHVAFPCTVLLQAVDARAHGISVFTASTTASASYVTTHVPPNAAFSGRPNWTVMTDPTATWSAVDVLQLCRVPSKPATTLAQPIAVEFTRDATFYVGHAVVHALVPVDRSSISYSNGFYRHRRKDLEHCYTMDSLPLRPPFFPTDMYNVVDICLNLARLQDAAAAHDGNDSTAAAASTEASPRAPNDVVEDQTTEIGRFRAFGDGRVRVVFTDRTIAAIDTDAKFCTLFLATGEVVTTTCIHPSPELDRYIHAGLTFRQWAFRTPAERADYVSQVRRQQDTVEAELRRNMRCLGDNRLDVVGAGSPSLDVRAVLAATAAHIHSVNRALQKDVGLKTRI